MQQVSASPTEVACWKPVYYVSQKLSDPESRYATIEREALAIVWGVQCLRSFVTGIEFTVVTDHKPLLNVFKPEYNLSSASLRVQRLLLKVQDLSFAVHYRPGKQNGLADFLSRAPVEDADINFLVVHHVTTGIDMPTDDRRRIAEQTAADPTLGAVQDALRSPHWPRQPILGPYEAIRHELSVWQFPGVDGFLILRGERVVIPTAATQRVIELAHSGHPGVDKTLQRLREAVWWPGFTKEVKQVLTNCRPCVIESKVRRVPLQPRRLPS